MNWKHLRMPHEFARFIDAIHVPEKTVKSISLRILKEPECFSILKGLSFMEKRKMIEKRATELETSARNLNELLTRARLSEILDDKYILKAKYQKVTNAFLELWLLSVEQNPALFHHGGILFWIKH